MSQKPDLRVFENTGSEKAQQLRKKLAAERGEGFFRRLLGGWITDRPILRGRLFGPNFLIE